MIDWDDANDLMIMSLFSSGWAWSALFALIGLAFAVAAHVNTGECKRMACPNGGRPMLVQGECICVAPATKEVALTGGGK